MKNKLTLGSLFDGSGGFPLGAVLSGIEPVWKSEIEPFCIAVTNARFPQMRHYGDVSVLNGAELMPVDIITFGSPCQDLSIFFEAIRIVKEMRCATNGKYPRFIVWENVPGAFSSNKGEDFRCVLEAVCRVKSDKIDVPESGKWANAGEIVADDFSIAWRVLDAQYWGVPQRRKRIFLVADFADKCAGKILFESEGLSRYSAESFRAWQKAARNAGTSSYPSSRLCLNDQGGNHMDVTEDVTCTLRAEAHHPPLVFENHSQDTRYTGPVETSQTVSSTFGMGGNNQPFVLETPKTLKIRCGCEGGGKGALVQDDLSATLSCNNDQTVFQPFAKGTRPHSADEGQEWKTAETANTLNTFDIGESRCNELAVKVCEKSAGFLTEPSANAHALGYEEEKAPTLRAGTRAAAVKAYGICSKDSNAMKSANPNSGFYEADTSRTLDGNGGNPTCNQGGIAVVEGNGSRPSHKGDGYRESEVMYTLNTIEQHAVAYGIDRAAFNQGKNALYDFAVEPELEPTIVAKGPGAVAEPCSFYPQMKAESQCFVEGVSNTIVNGTNPGYQNGVIQPLYSTSHSSHFTRASENIASSLLATDYKDPPLVNDTNGVDYIVRRLTPTECARLQGFPDWWCSDIDAAEPTEDDLTFWREVFETHRNVIGTSSKPKTDKQIIKWLKDPYSDSAEYRMWGNGISLPCVVFVLSGIAYYADIPDFLL